MRADFPTMTLKIVQSRYPISVQEFGYEVEGSRQALGLEDRESGIIDGAFFIIKSNGDQRWKTFLVSRCNDIRCKKRVAQ